MTVSGHEVEKDPCIIDYGEFAAGENHTGVFDISQRRTRRSRRALWACWANRASIPFAGGQRTKSERA